MENLFNFMALFLKKKNKENSQIQAVLKRFLVSVDKSLLDFPTLAIYKISKTKEGSSS